MHEICQKMLKYAHYMPLNAINMQLYAVLVKYVKKYARNMPEICLNMQDICRYMPKICRPEICNKNANI